MGLYIDKGNVEFHLGYLAYDIDTGRCYIPDLEVRIEIERIFESAEPYLCDSRSVYRIGVNISSATRTVSEWKVVSPT